MNDYQLLINEFNNFLIYSSNSITTIPIADLIGWIGNLFFIYGVWAIGEKRVNGFYFNFVGNFAYVVQGYMKGTSSLLVLSFLLMFLNVQGILKWRKDKKILAKGTPRYLGGK